MATLISAELLRQHGVGRRKRSDVLFRDDPTPPRLGVRDEDDEELCHELIKSTCSIPGCRFSTHSLLEYEGHYNASHRYSCSECKKTLPSPHLLDLHVQEQHDSFFAVMALRKPSYSCYVEWCKEKFMTAEERLYHCVSVHKMPKDFRFDQKPKPKKPKSKNKKPITGESSMDVDKEQKPFYFTNSKQKAFAKYTGSKFTTDSANKEKTATDVNMDEVITDLKNSLPTQ